MHYQLLLDRPTSPLILMKQKQFYKICQRYLRIIMMQILHLSMISIMHLLLHHRLQERQAQDCGVIASKVNRLTT